MSSPIMRTISQRNSKTTCCALLNELSFTPNAYFSA